MNEDGKLWLLVLQFSAQLLQDALGQKVVAGQGRHVLYGTTSVERRDRSATQDSEQPALRRASFTTKRGRNGCSTPLATGNSYNR